MDINAPTTTKKALNINLDDSRYGTFAEIGAGQEVARHFFQAGRASHTIAKTISAYDMTFSDSIYGKSGRYVSLERLDKMLSHEYDLLEERLGPPRGKETAFFSFADTVATSTDSNRCHGWMGVRYQTHPQGPVNEIVVHVRLLDRFRLQQQEALGILGVNLIHGAFYQIEDGAKLIASLQDNLSNKRIEINMIRFSGQELSHIDNRLMSLELVKQGLAEAILFGPKAEMLQPSDALYQKPILVQRGAFRPVTKVNVEILEKGLEQINKDLDGKKPTLMFEITMQDWNAQTKDIDMNDLLDRVDTLCTLGHMVLVSNFFLFYQLKSYLRLHTSELVGLVIGASHLEKVFDAQYYRTLPGGVLEGFSRLFDDKTKIYVYPFKSELLCSTAQTFHPAQSLDPLYKYFLSNKMIVDIAGCDEIDTSVHSKDVRTMLASGNKDWEKLVPGPVRDRIKSLYLFGYKA